MCGDTLIDLALGEQCDDGVVGISGDGCSSACKSELDFWSNVGPRLPARRSESAVANDPIVGVMMFGGTPGSGAETSAAGETWRWTASTWQLLAPPTGSPPRRSKAAIGYDPLRRRVVMFGGRAANGGVLADLWEWDGIVWTERAAPNGPSARVDASMACGPARCVLFGGRVTLPALKDTWIWDGVTWNELTGTPSPSARASAAMAYDNDRQVIVLYGGNDGATILHNDTWELSTSWISKAPTPSPAVNGTPSATYDDRLDLVIMISGAVAYSYNGTTWTTLTPPPAVNSAKLAYDRQRERVIAVYDNDVLIERNGTTWDIVLAKRPVGTLRSTLATYDPRRGRTVIIDNELTFEWDGANWWAVPLAVNRPSLDSAIAFDRACDTAVTFGAASGSGALGDTWTYNNAQWTKSPPSGPPVRMRHAMTYDEKREVVLMFGGISSMNQHHNDLWEWRGACGIKQWVNVTPMTGPSARSKAALAYDPVREVTVLFGGTNGAVSFGDTWEWDGTAWSAKSPPLSPEPRAEHMMAYDPRNRSVTLYGGAFGPSVTDDTWRWNGTTWTQLSPLLSPPARSSATLAQDVTGNLILFGGEPPSFSVAQVWRLAAAPSAGETETCRNASVDLDGDALLGCADPDCGYRCKPMCLLGSACSGPPSCGDGGGSLVEDHLICPADCPPPPP